MICWTFTTLKREFNAYVVGLNLKVGSDLGPDKQKQILTTER